MHLGKNWLSSDLNLHWRHDLQARPVMPVKLSLTNRRMTDEYYMMLALKEAKRAYEAGEVPVGAVVILNDRIIARGYNMVERLNDPTAHAEMIALTSAFNFNGSKYLPEASLYVTVEPCLMCAGALYWSRIRKVVWGAPDEKNGHKHITDPQWPFHPKTEVIHGILKDECGQLMKDFFKPKR
jgi:tRNA(adenine34) deaminase